MGRDCLVHCYRYSVSHSNFAKCFYTSMICHDWQYTCVLQLNEILNVTFGWYVKRRMTGQSALSQFLLHSFVVTIHSHWKSTKGKRGSQLVVMQENNLPSLFHRQRFLFWILSTNGYSCKYCVAMALLCRLPGLTLIIKMTVGEFFTHSKRHRNTNVLIPIFLFRIASLKSVFWIDGADIVYVVRKCFSHTIF